MKLLRFAVENVVNLAPCGPGEINATKNSLIPRLLPMGVKLGLAFCAFVRAGHFWFCFMRTAAGR